jgi:predicted phage-related endonuclease
VELPESAVAWYEARQQAKEEIKSLQRAVDEADSRFKAALKTAAYGLLPDGRAVSWKSHERAAYTVEAQTVRPLKFLNKLPRDVAKHGDFINVSSDTPAIEAIAGSAAESSAQSD